MTKLAGPDAIRAKQAAAACEAAEHEKPLLDEVADILAQIAPLTDRLAAIAPDLLTDYMPVHLNVLSDDRRRAASSLATARANVAAALEG